MENNKAFEAGSAAYWDSKPLSRNPYDGIRGRDWVKGWMDARESGIGMISLSMSPVIPKYN